MNTEDKNIKMRKRNMKLFPMYKALGWDLLFYYTIDFLFFTQVKDISAAGILIKDSFYSIFSIIMQIPSSIIVAFLGRKNSLVFANIINCFAIVIIMISKNLYDIILAEFIFAMAYSIKGIVENSLLNSSIPPSKNKGKIFSKINAKGNSRYFLLGAITKIIAGYLFTVNAYLPMICSLVVLIIVTLISICFIEPIEKKNTSLNANIISNQLKDLRDGFKFVLKSKRLKAIILSTSLIWTIYSILRVYSLNQLQELCIPSTIIGIISAVLSIVSAYSSKKHESFNIKFKNKSLTIVGLSLSICCLITGITGIFANKYVILICVISIIYALLIGFGCGMGISLKEKYLRNFTNAKIDTKIFATSNLFEHITVSLGLLLASFLIDKTTTINSLIIIGVLFTIVFLLLSIYMKSRTGLKPEEYSKEERKYDELSIHN